MDAAKEAVETIARSEAQHSRSDSTTTTETTATIQSIKRTFSNPYRDRTLQLRFIPVFRHFEVRTRPASVKPGVALHVGAVRAVSGVAEQAGGLRISDALAVAPSHVDPAALQQPLAHLLSGTQDTRVAAKGASPAGATAAGVGGSPVGALLWSQSIVREDSVLVPLAEAETAASAFGLKGQARKNFLDTLARIARTRWRSSFRSQFRTCISSWGRTSRRSPASASSRTSRRCRNRPKSSTPAKIRRTS
jgi:hypothetical protein